MPETTDEQIRRVYVETIEPLRSNVLRRSGGDRDLTDDVVQETWLRAVRAWRGDGLPVRPSAWLTTVSRNLLASEYRRRRHVRLDDSHEAFLVSEAQDSATNSVELETAVRRALASMSPDEEQLIRAFHFDRRRISAIAESMRISERAVEGRLRRARKNLHRNLRAILNEESNLLSIHPVKAGWSDLNLSSIGMAMKTGVLLPLLMVLGGFQLSRIVQHLPRRRLVYLRFFGGIGLILLSTMAAQDSPSFSQYGLAAFGVGMILWSIWNVKGLRRNAPGG